MLNLGNIFGNAAANAAPKKKNEFEETKPSETTEVLSNLQLIDPNGKSNTKCKTKDENIRNDRYTTRRYELIWFIYLMVLVILFNNLFI